MLEKLKTIQDKYEELTGLLMDQSVLSKPAELLKYSKEQAELQPLVEKIKEYKKLLSDMEGAEDLLKEGDGDLRKLAQEELEELKEKKPKTEEELKLMLLPKDPRDEKNVILEIRAGTGGEEAALFGANLLRMYMKYAEYRRWKVETIDLNATGLGGIKEVIISIQGKNAYSRLKYESGVHRVQRVPVTEASGRIHTSTATVAVLPKAEEVDIEIDPDDLRIDVFHSGGAGGQNVNKVATAIRITHLPTNMVVICQDERSQLRNKNKAMAVLRARLLDIERARQEDEMVKQRRSQVGSGDRSEKIRTYNFPQDRLTDHRIGMSLHNLPKVMAGEFDQLIDALASEDQAKQLAGQLA